MFKKILTGAILLGLLLAGSLMADNPQDTYYYDVEVEIHGFANTLEIGYIAQDGIHYPLPTFHNITGTFTTGFSVDPNTQYPPEKIFAEGWGQYGWHDYDECDAQLYYTNHLELWLNGAYPYPFYPEPLEE